MNPFTIITKVYRRAISQCLLTFFGVFGCISIVYAQPCTEGPGSALQLTGVTDGGPFTSVTFQWTDNCPAAQNYQLQVLRLYNSSPMYIGKDTIQAKIDWGQALNIFTNVGTGYKGVPPNVGLFTCVLAEGAGYYAWRIRRVYGFGFNAEGDGQNYGQWTTYAPFTDGASVVVNPTINSGNIHVFWFTPFDTNINWIYRRQFTEGEPDHTKDVRIADQTTFADKLLNPIQEQSGMRYYDMRSVTQIVPDNSGRPSLKSLPGAAPGPAGYVYQFFKNNLHQPYNADNYDQTPTYHSPSDADFIYDIHSDNPNPSVFPDIRTPDAQGKGYSRTLYYNDGTNRVREIASPGLEHSFASNNTIKKYYAKATTTELIKIFGDEAPKSESINKTYTRDPNGVYNVEYTDEQGRTVATALTTPRSSLLDAIPGETFTNRDTLTTKTEIAPYTLLTKATYTFAKPTQLSYIYNIIPKVYGDKCLNLCATCDYQVKLVAKERDDIENQNVYTADLELVPNINTKDYDCKEESHSLSDVYSIPNDPLDPGTYDISLILYTNTIDPGTGKPYIDGFVETMHGKLNDAFAANGSVLPYGYPCNLGTVQQYLNAKDINGLIAYTGADTSQPTFNVVFNNGCDTIVLPTLHCAQPQCYDPKFSQYMIDVLKQYDIDHDTDFYANVYAGVSGNIGYTTSTQNWFLLADNVEFDSLIRRMANDGYSCDVLWDAWVKTANSYASMQIGLGNGAAQLGTSTPKFDWWTEFMQRVGYKFAISPQPASQLTTVGSNVRKYPYKYFPYTWGTYVNLENAFASVTPCTPLSANPPCWNGTISNFPSSPTGNVFHMFNFYQAVRQYADTNATSNWVNVLNQYGGIYTNTGNTNISQSVGIMKNECMKACDNRTQDAFSQIAADFMDIEKLKIIGYPYETWRPAAVDSVPMSYIYCMANSVIATCKAGCDVDSSGYFKKSVQAAFTNSMTARLDIYATSYKVAPLDRPNCAATGYSTVPLVPSNKIKNYLNELNYRRNNAITGMLNSGATSATFSTNTFSSICNQSFPLSYNDKDGEFAFGSRYVDSNGGPCAAAGVAVYRYRRDSVFFNDDVTIRFKVRFTAALAKGDSILITDNIPSGTNFRSGSGRIIAGPAIRMVIRGPKSIGDTLSMSYTVATPAVFTKSGFNGGVTRYTSGVPSAGCNLINDTMIITNCMSLKYISMLNPNDPAYITLCGNICADNELCDGKLCYRWIPNMDTLAQNDTTVKAHSCGEIMCQAFSDALDLQLARIHERHEAQLRADYEYKCLNRYNINDQFVNLYQEDLYQFTLFYYDRAGNLIRTVSPKGVNTATGTRVVNPQHTYATQYAYNTLGQKVLETTPDGGTTKFWYDAFGRLGFSQNAKQAGPGVYSYIKYDNLNRVIEVGQTSGTVAQSDLDAGIWGGPGTDITQTVYTTPYKLTLAPFAGYTGFMPGGQFQRLINNRISYAIRDRDGDISTMGDQAVTIYSYDPHGNVEYLYQWVAGMAKGRCLRYQYNIFNGKPYHLDLLNVDTTADPTDVYGLKFDYDGDSRLKGVYKNPNGYHAFPNGGYSNQWVAAYTYQRDNRLEVQEYGPILAPIQVVDYTYTVEGWLKAINTSDPTLDPGAGIGATRPDKFGMMLNYYYGDYNRSGSPVFDNLTLNSERPALLTNQYNGNISAWQMYTDTTVGTVGLLYPRQTVANVYRYDEVYRLTSSKSARRAGTWSSPDFYRYGETFSYDKNGNITGAQKYVNASPAAAEAISYNYTPNTNKLSSAFFANTVYGTTGGTKNFTYDANGNVTQDDKLLRRNFQWDPYGKLIAATPIPPATDPLITYLYDANGNKVKETQNAGGTRTSTYFINDATGNIIATYQDINGSGFAVTQRHLYGTEHLGTLYGANLTTPPYSPTSPGLPSAEYELKDHLGTVRATFDEATGNTLSFWNDGAYGYMQMNREGGGSSQQRFGFQGKERDNWVGTTPGFAQTINFGARLYVPQLGRFMSIDPQADKRSWISPYNFVQNNPIRRIDPTGEIDNTYEVDRKAGTVTKVDDKGGDDKDYIHEKNVPISDDPNVKATGDLSYTIPVNKMVYIKGHWGETFRGPGYIAHGSLDQGMVTPVDDPFTSMGPSFLKWGVQKITQVAASRAATALELGAKESTEFLYHYTNKGSVENILQEGLTVTEKRPFVYTTPASNLSPLQAQIELALPANRTLPNTILKVDVTGIKPVMIRRTTGNIPGMGAGGGTEVLFNQSIPASRISIVPSK